MDNPLPVNIPGFGSPAMILELLQLILHSNNDIVLQKKLQLLNDILIEKLNSNIDNKIE